MFRCCLKKMFLPLYQYWNHCYLCRRKLTSIVGCWNLCILFVIGSSSKLSNHFIIFCCIGCDNPYYYWYCILRSIIIWEARKVVVQINQGQQLSICIFIVIIFSLTRIYCFKIHCQESEFVGIHYYQEDLKVIFHTRLRVNHRHHMLLFISEIICVNYHNYWNQKIISSLLSGSNLWFFFLTRLFLYVLFVTGSNKFFDLYIKSAPGEYYSFIFTR